jgi:hypothetical protein
VPLRNLGPHVWCIHMACCWAYAGIKVHDYDRSKWYLHTMVILSLVLLNPTSKASAWKEFYLKQRKIWIAKMSVQIPYYVPKQRDFKLKIFVRTNFYLKQNNLWGKKNLEKFCCVKNPFAVKTLGLFQTFWKSCSYFKMPCEKILQNPLCVSLKNFEKRRFSSNNIFKSAFLWKLVFKVP